MKTWQVLPLIAISVFAAIAQERKVAAIDFFGHQGMDIETIRRTLPFHEGEIAPKGGFGSWKDSARKAVLAVTGRESTDQALVCCWNGNWVAHIGLRGSSFVEPKLKSAPVGSTMLPKEFMKLDREFNRAWEESVKTGQREHLNTQWRAMREMAPRHEPALLDAGVNAADSVHRAAAVFAIGHALAPSTSRLAVLLDAAHDPDSTVRNNAVRGLENGRTSIQNGVGRSPQMSESGSLRHMV